MRGAIFATIMLASPLAAQDRMTLGQCVSSIDALTDLAPLPTDLPDVDVDNEGWCLLGDVEIDLDQNSGVHIDALRWRASDIARFTADGLPPRTFDLQGTGVSATARMDDPVFDYLIGLQMRQTQADFAISFRWDGVQNALTVSDAFLAFDDTNRIEASARIEGVDLTDRASIQTSLGTAGLRSLSLKSDFDGWFETYLATAIGTMILTRGEQPPEAQVTALKQQAIEFIDTLPDENIPEPSRGALSDFVRALPTPRGTAQLQISAQPVIGATWATRLAATARDGAVADLIAAGLDGTTVLFTWASTGGSQ